MLDPKRPRLDGFVGTILVGGLAAAFLYLDLSFAMKARACQGVVRGFWVGYRASPNLVDVAYRVGGRTVVSGASVGYGRLRVGDVVEVLVDPEDPRNFVLDRYWQKYYRSTIAVIGFEVVAMGEAWARMSRSRWRRRLSDRPGQSVIHDKAARAIVDEAVEAAHQGVD